MALSVLNDARMRATATTVVVLFGLLLFQSIWLIGTTTLRDHGKLRQELAQVRDEIARIKVAGAADNTDGARATTIASLIEPLSKKEDDLVPQIASADVSLCVWNRLWKWVVPWTQRQPCDQLMTADQLGERRSANGATQVLGLYLLPLFYGWLGALLWVVQKLREDDSPQAVEKLKPSSRVVTGMVAGPMIGMFLSPEFLNSLAFQATPFVIAFLGGYSTDVFFAVIERFLGGFRRALTRQPVDASTQPTAQTASTRPAAPAPGS